MRTKRDDNRLQLNLELLRILEAYLRTYEDMRFSQALINLGLVDPGKDEFYVEPSELLKRVKSSLEDRGGR